MFDNTVCTVPVGVNSLAQPRQLPIFNRLIQLRSCIRCNCSYVYLSATLTFLVLSQQGSAGEWESANEPAYRLLLLLLQSTSVEHVMHLRLLLTSERVAARLDFVMLYRRLLGDLCLDTACRRYAELQPDSRKSACSCKWKRYSPC